MYQKVLCQCVEPPCRDDLETGPEGVAFCSMCISWLHGICVCDGLGFVLHLPHSWRAAWMSHLISVFQLFLMFTLTWICDSSSHLCRQGDPQEKQLNSFQVSLSRGPPPLLSFPQGKRCGVGRRRGGSVRDLVSLNSTFCISVISDSTSNFRKPNSKLYREDGQIFAHCTWSLKR